MERRRLMVGVGAVAAGAGVAVPGVTRASSGPLRVQIVMFDGVEEQDFAGPYEVFSLAGALSGGAVQVSYVTGGRPRTVAAAFGTRVAVDRGWSPGAADLIVVPGGGFRRPDEPGIWPEINKGDLPRRLAAGITSGLELALHLVRREVSAEVATRTEGVLEYEARGTVWTP